MHGSQSDVNAKRVTFQVRIALGEKCAYGEKRQELKLTGADKDKIVSRGTYSSYVKMATGFVKWANEKYGVNDLESAHQYAKEYIQMRNANAHISAYTVSLDKCALAKMYGESTRNYGETKTRLRSEITRSRGAVLQDRHFSLERNKELIEFGRGTGLRRAELSNLRGTDLNKDKTIHVVGKGGRPRDIEIIGPHREEIIARMESAGTQKVWDKVPKAMDEHSYRSEYATAYYKMCAREVKEIPKADRYCCRGDLKGIWYDRVALEKVSHQLGHNRDDIVAGHYIR